MEVIEDGNIMDRIPILLQRDFEYYQTNQTVLSETVCPGVVGGRLDFPRTASFAAVKIVIWLEEEFSIAFKHGSGMFVLTEEEEKADSGVAKTSDPDKFVQLAIKSADMLLEHLHVLVQEALDHADLPVLTATLGAAALLRNALHCYVQVLEDSGSSERHSLLQACYKRFATMSEAVAERVLDLHNRVLSLYVLQEGGGRKGAGSPSVQGWWLYMQGTKKDLWDTVPPRMAQRIFAGMLNETLTILTVRYCQSNTRDSTPRLLVNDIINILQCAARLLPAVCGSGGELCGVGRGVGAGGRHVRDVHAKCGQLYACMVYRGADLHYIQQAFKENEDAKEDTVNDSPCPWFMFVSPHLFESLDENEPRELTRKAAIGLEMQVLLAQPQPSWSLLVKVLLMRSCGVSRVALMRAARRATAARWPGSGLWCGGAEVGPCAAFLCTADGICKFQSQCQQSEEYGRAMGALTYVLATVGNKAELKSTLIHALELSGEDWAACLDKRQVWCDLRPSWLAAILSMIGSALEFIPAELVKAIQTGASMYQTMSVCLSCISRAVDCLPRSVFSAAAALQESLPARVCPAGNSVLLQLLLTRVYEELQQWAKGEAVREKATASDANGEPHTMGSRNKARPKQVRIVSLGRTTTSSSVSFDGNHSSASCCALAAAEALCAVDEDDKHTEQISHLTRQLCDAFTLTNQFGLEDFPEFAGFLQEGEVAGARAERSCEAAALTSQLLMSPAGRDSLRVIYDHLQNHSEAIYKDLGIQENIEGDIEIASLNKAPLLYIMFHIGRRPFDEYLSGACTVQWPRECGRAHARGGARAARAHLLRRHDARHSQLYRTLQSTDRVDIALRGFPSHALTSDLVQKLINASKINIIGKYIQPT